MPQVTGASHPVKFGDRAYDMSPLTDKDIDEVDNWLRSTYLQTARLGLEGLNEEERQELLGVALKTARGLSFMSKDGAKIAGSLDGVTRVVWQGLKVNHPSLTYDAFKAEIFALKKVDAEKLGADLLLAMSIWSEINVGAKIKAKDDTTNPPQPANQPA